MTEAANAVEIVVNFDPVFRKRLAEPEWYARAHDMLHAYCAELMRALGLACDSTVALRTELTDPDLALDVFRVSINGRRCRQRVPVQDKEHAWLRTVPERIAQALCDNRELLLVEPAPECPEGVAPEGFRAVLIEGIRRGYSADRVAAWVRVRPEVLRSVRPPAVQLEEIAASAGPLPVRVRYPAAAGMPDAAARQQELSGEIGRQLLADPGIDPGEIVFEPGPELEPNAFQITLNDLPLPDGRWEAANAEGGGAAAGNHDSLVSRVLTVLRGHSGSLLTLNDVAARFKSVRDCYPALAEAASARFDLPLLATVLRLLLDEELPIRDLRGILECLLATNATHPKDLSSLILFPPGTARFCQAARGRPISQWTPKDLAEAARSGFQRHLSLRYSSIGLSGLPLKDGNERIFHSGRVHAVLIAEEIEQVFRENGAAAIPERVVPMFHAAFADCMQERYLQQHGPGGREQPLVITTAPRIRHDLREAIGREFPALPVLSYDELTSGEGGVQLDVVGKIEFGKSGFSYFSPLRAFSGFFEEMKTALRERKAAEPGPGQTG